jgi:hypothetical protein
MRRIGVALCSCAAVAAIISPLRSADRPLPLSSERPLTPRLLAVVSDGQGARLAEMDPASLSARRTSARVGFFDGWVVSPDRKALAVAVRPPGGDVTFSRLMFANVSTLRWDRRGLRLDGDFRAALWPRAGRLLALAGDCCGPGLALETIDTVRKKVIAHKAIERPVWSIARSADPLVLLATETNAIGPVRLLVVAADGSIRSVTLARILGGSHFDETSADPLGTTRRPGLAVDPAEGVAYVVDPDGIVAEVRLADLAVGYHDLGSSSLLARLSSWLTPAAQAKGLNGPELSARWLGDGLIAVTRSDETATRSKQGDTVVASTAGGLAIVDTADWTVRMLDSGADSAVVADGLLLATGDGWRSETAGSTSTSTIWGNGVAAYGPEGRLRWRLHPGVRTSVVAVYGTHAVVQQAGDPNTAPRPLELVDLGTGAVASMRPADAYPWLLLGSGS